MRSKRWSGKLGEDQRHKLGNGGFGVALLLLLHLRARDHFRHVELGWVANW